MKKTVSGLLLALLLTLALPLGGSAAAAGFSGGSGTKSDPYIIATAEDLAAIPSGTTSAYYLQTADIDLGGVKNWRQITLSGTYDGGGYQISNFSAGTGLFGSNSSSGTIRNVNLTGMKVTGGEGTRGGIVNRNSGLVENCSVQGTMIGSAYSGIGSEATLGGIAGSNSGTIRGCTILEGSDINGDSASGSSGITAGGIAGENSGTIQDSHNAGATLMASGQPSNSAGGIVGSNTGKVTGCTNAGTISGGYTGGIVGSGGRGTTVGDCVNTGTINGLGYSAGGIVGNGSSITITRCSNTGTVYANATTVDNKCGGIVGIIQTSKILECCNLGDVVGADNYLGGIAGYSNVTYIINCYNRGDIGGQESDAPVGTYKKNGIGGLAGYYSSKDDPHIQNCYNTGTVSGSAENTDLGALTGKCFDSSSSKPAIWRCYWPDDSGLPAAGNASEKVLEECEALSRAELQSITMVEKLRKAQAIWFYDVQGKNDGYPVLEWQCQDLLVQADAEPGLYVDPFDVILTSPAGGQIWYTLDGSDPLTSDTRAAYSSAVHIFANCTLKACAVYDQGYSPVSTFEYRIAQYPVFPSMEAGVYNEYPTDLTLSCPSAPGALIYYTIDGSDPKTSSTRKAFSGSSIYFVKSTVIRTVAQMDGTYGDVLDYEYVISPTITASEPGGEQVHGSPLSITLTSSLAEYKIYYTINGADPRTSGKLYEGPIGIGGTVQLKAAGRYGDSWGEVYTFEYRFEEPVITAEPLRTMPEGYAYYLKISCTQDHLDIYTDINGTFEPYTSDYDVPIYQTTELTVQLRYGEQIVKEQTFRYELPELKFQLTPPSDVIYDDRITVKLNCLVYGVIIRYTLDGSDPVLSDLGGISSPDQPLEIPLDRSCTLRVVAMWENRQEPILEGSYTYTLNMPGIKASKPSGTCDRPFDLNLSVTGTSDLAFYEILYTTDGSDPMVDGQIYTGPILVDRSVTIRAVPRYTVNGHYGTPIELNYHFDQFVSLGNELTLYDDEGDHYITAELTSNFPDPKQVELWAVLYDSKGRMVDSKRLGEADLTAYHTTPVKMKMDYEPGVDPMDQAYDLRVFVLERETMVPLNEVQTPKRVEVPKLERITVGKGVYEVWLGAYGDYIRTTAHYTAGGEDKLLDAASCQYSSSNPDVAYVESGSGIIRFKQEGDAIITVTYSEGGRTATAYIYVKVSIPVYREHPAVPDFGAINHYSPYLVEDSGYVYDLPSDFSAIESYYRTLERMGFSYQPSISDPANGKVYYMTSRVGVQITMLKGSLYIIIVYNPYA